jgi:topoisomerase-4 subunit B
MNIETRQLVKVTIEDAALAERRITTLMGDNTVIRKE